MYIGAVEAGGTKMCCAVADENGNLIQECSIATTNPSDTFNSIAEFFNAFSEEKQGKLDAIGLGWFGPIDVDMTSDGYGVIGKTPKPGWAKINVIDEIRKRLKAFDGEISVTTDVNSSLIGECWLGQGKSLDDVCYITIGTGIGAGIKAKGQLIGGFSHPEFGHICVPRVEGDDFEGVCPSHGCCFEGMASGPAIEKRWGIPGAKLPNDHIGWDYEADYIASALVTLILTVCPKKIILGGGVMRHLGLLDKTREKVSVKLAEYIDLSSAGGINEIIVGESLGGRQGILGCVRLALDCMHDT